MDEKKRTNKVKFKYIFPEDYTPLAMSGVIGGVSPAGDVVASFFFERNALPNEEEFTLNADGTIGKATKSDPPDYQTTIIRSVQSGVIMRLETAEILKTWLEEKIEAAKELRARLSETPDTKKPEEAGE
jgi:hypothetical protein